MPRIARPRAVFLLAVSAFLAMTGDMACTRAGAAETPTPLPVLDARGRAAVIDSLSAALDSLYVFPDKAKAMEELLRSRLSAGRYNALLDPREFADKLTEDLRSVSDDPHLQVLGVTPPVVQEKPAGTSDTEEAQRQLAATARHNFGFEKLERMAGNVGYLELLYFADAGPAGATAVAAMNFLANSSALIIDLRLNQGGSPSMVQLLSSYLLACSTHLNDYFNRPLGSVQQSWSQEHVTGRRLDKIPVFVLTSARTFSAAEEFAYNLKTLNRATIVGETTAGGAHETTEVCFAGLPVVARIPYARAINPITGTNWEGTGVKPDVDVSADQALAAAHLAALDSLAARATDAGLRREVDWARTAVRAQVAPLVLDAKTLQSYVGAYGPRRVLYEDGTLTYLRPGWAKARLVPAERDLFLIEGADFFHVRFERDPQGHIVKLIDLYADGRFDEEDRDRR